VRCRRARSTVWHRPARAALCVSRPVSGLASGSLSVRPHLPVLAAQWSVAGLGARLPLRGQRRHCIHMRMLTGFPFHPRGAFAPQGHLRQTETLRGRIQACKSGTVTRVFPAHRRGIAQGPTSRSWQTWCPSRICRCGLHSTLPCAPSSSMRPQLQLAAPVVDDERVEEPQRVHADQTGSGSRGQGASARRCATIAVRVMPRHRESRSCPAMIGGLSNISPPWTVRS